MSTQRPSMSDQDLWRSLAVENQTMPGTLTDIDLAAWLEGRLAPADAARVDSILAADPVQRAAAVELSEILALPFPAAPARLVVRAQALVGFEVERQARRRGRASSLRCSPPAGVRPCATPPWRPRAPCLPSAVS